MTRQELLDNTCKQRGLPSLAVGNPCEVDGRTGIIVGGNYSANLDVVFDGDNFASNCHPHWQMKIYNHSGDEIYRSDDA